jgi:hypothetical protein
MWARHTSAWRLALVLLLALFIAPGISFLLIL